MVFVYIHIYAYTYIYVYMTKRGGGGEWGDEESWVEQDILFLTAAKTK